MRKQLATIAVVGLAFSAILLPAHARGQKVEDSFTAQAIPLPNLSSSTGTDQRSCLAGLEGVHKVSHPFSSKAAGILDATLEGFTGDWDLFITDADGNEILGSVGDQATAGAPAEEEVALTLKPKQEVNIVACNWLGEPEVTVNYTFVPGKKKGH